MIPAPLMPVTSAQTSHSRLVPRLVSPATDEQAENPRSAVAGASVHGLSHTTTLVMWYGICLAGSGLGRTAPALKPAP